MHLVVILTVIAMEGIAYAVHRWIMHGPVGSGWHESHHEGRHDAFEKNDLYAVFFAALLIALFALGNMWLDWMWWLAVGMTLYSAIYLVTHGGLMHQRWPFRHVPRRGYLRRLYQAHRLYHAVEGREDCVSFGFVYAPPLERLKAQLRASGVLGVLAQRQSRH